MITCICHKFVDSSISGINSQGMLPITMFEYLVIHNIFLYDVYMDYKVNSKYKLHYLNLEECLFKKKMIECSNIFVSITTLNINNWFFISYIIDPL